MPDPWPDLDGPCPDDWEVHHWLAATTLHNGGSLADAGQKVDRKRGTISGWVTRWRAQYGREFLRGGNRQSERPLTDEDRARGRNVAIDLQRQGWDEVRALASTELASVALTAGEVVRKGLEGLLKDEARLLLLEPRDLRHLMVIADMLTKRADALLDIPDHRRGALERGRVGAGNENNQPPPGLLARLEGDDADRVAEAQRDAVESAELFFLRLATSDGEPVDESIETSARKVE